jgi:hypothetical protein
MKPDRLVTRVSANLDVLHFPKNSANLDKVRCLHCSSALSLHQPDLETPGRLLGVCEPCKRWFLIDVLIDLSGGLMVRLPDMEVIRDLSRANPSAGISLMGRDGKE